MSKEYPWYEVAGVGVSLWLGPGWVDVFGVLTPAALTHKYHHYYLVLVFTPY